jgi:hypothetical protein
VAQTCAHATQAAAVKRKRKRKSSSSPTLLPSPSREKRHLPGGFVSVVELVVESSWWSFEVVVWRLDELSYLGRLPTTCETSAKQLEDRPLLSVLEIEDVFQ